MAHSEQCPVCGGGGVVSCNFQPGVMGGTTDAECKDTKQCHGCEGYGYIVVGQTPCDTVLEPDDENAIVDVIKESLDKVNEQY